MASSGEPSSERPEEEAASLLPSLEAMARLLREQEEDFQGLARMTLAAERKERAAAKDRAPG